MRDSCGISETGETPQEQGDEEAHRLPHGKRASCNGKQAPICKKHPKRIVNHPFLIALNQVKIIHEEDFITAKFELNRIKNIFHTIKE
jgi:hypothetical protein